MIHTQRDPQLAFPLPSSSLDLAWLLAHRESTLPLILIDPGLRRLHTLARGPRMRSGEASAMLPAIGRKDSPSHRTDDVIPSQWCVLTTQVVLQSM